MDEPCPLCRAPALRNAAEELAVLRRHVENEVPEAYGNQKNEELVKLLKEGSAVVKKGVFFVGFV